MIATRTQEKPKAVVEYPHLGCVKMRQYLRKQKKLLLRQQMQIVLIRVSRKKLLRGNGLGTFDEQVSSFHQPTCTTQQLHTRNQHFTISIHTLMHTAHVNTISKFVYVTSFIVLAQFEMKLYIKNEISVDIGLI